MFFQGWSVKHAKPCLHVLFLLWPSRVTVSRGDGRHMPGLWQSLCNSGSLIDYVELAPQSYSNRHLLGILARKRNIFVIHQPLNFEVLFFSVVNSSSVLLRTLPHVKVIKLGLSNGYDTL